MIKLFERIKGPLILGLGLLGLWLFSRNLILNSGPGAPHLAADLPLQLHHPLSLLGVPHGTPGSGVPPHRAPAAHGAPRLVLAAGGRRV